MTVNFFDRVYKAVQEIPQGKVASYGQIALIAGCPQGARAVGNALHKNPLPGIIPCHRVVNVHGRLAPGFAFGGTGRQRELLEHEGVTFNCDGFVNMKIHRWRSSGVGVF